MIQGAGESIVLEHLKNTDNRLPTLSIDVSHAILCLSCIISLLLESFSGKISRGRLVSIRKFLIFSVLSIEMSLIIILPMPMVIGCISQLVSKEIMANLNSFIYYLLIKYQIPFIKQ